MALDITIRSLTEDDQLHWYQMWNAYLYFYETSVTEEVSRTAFSRLLSSEPGEFQGVIAEVDGKPFGLTHFLFHRFLCLVEDTYYLMDLFADPSVRGQGVGRALIKSVYEAVKATGIPSVYWITQEFNYNGRMLYDQVAKRTPFIVYEKHD